MTEFYEAIADLFRYVAGSDLTLKTLPELTEEIEALVGTSDWSWICYFLAPENLLSLLIYGGMAYACWFLVLYVPWRLFRRLVRVRGGKV